MSQLIRNRTPLTHSLHQTLGALEYYSDRFYDKPLMKYLQNYPKSPLKILEMGSGFGAMTERLMTYGTVTATDNDPVAILHLQEKFKNTDAIQIFHWDATASPTLVETPTPISEGNYDLIIAFNVLEHLPNQEEVLRQWASLLSPQGNLVILVPYGPAFYNILDKAVGHFRRYTLKGLQHLMVKIGGDLVETHYLNPLGILGWVFNGLLLKRDYLPEGQLKLYYALKSVLRPFEFLLEQLVGLSVFAVIRFRHQKA